jgi:hypothetical protein
MVGAKLANLGRGRPVENAQICALSQDDAADMLQVSRRSVQTAAKVSREAPAPVVEAVSADERGALPGNATLAPGAGLTKSAYKMVT